DDLARLADLRGVRVPAGVDNCARSAYRTPERLRELLGQREILRCTEPAAAGDDHVRVLDRRAARLLSLLRDDLRAARVFFEVDAHLLDRRFAAGGFGGVERAGTEEREARCRAPADVDEHRILERRPLADEVARQV